MSEHTPAPDELSDPQPTPSNGPPDTGPAEPAHPCFHLFHHARTPAERQQVIDQIDYARSVGDMQALPSLLLRLQPCPPPPVEPAAPSGQRE